MKKTNKNNPFYNPWYKKNWLLIYKNKLKSFYYHLKYPENIWYGGGIKRELALPMVGKGWSGIINNLYDAKPKHVRITTVKEKYGTLRFYTMSSPEWYDDLISYYEHESSKICEQCGKPGETRFDRGWYLTLCDDCDRLNKEEWQKRMNKFNQKDK